MTLLTSLYPSTHGLNRAGSAFFKRPQALAADKVTLAELLKARGYRTWAETGGATVAGKLGFARGFDVYGEGAGKLSPALWDRLAAFLADRAEAPFFLFLHTFEVHAPYMSARFAEGVASPEQRNALEQAILRTDSSGLDGHRSALWRQQKAYLHEQGLYRPEVTAALYDGGIRLTDEFLGRLFAELRRLGIYDRTLVVITSDHGEAFGERDPTWIYDEHGHAPFSEMAHVPMLLHLPGYSHPGRVIDAPVGLVDVAPTILDLVGAPIPRSLQGLSLAPLLLGQRSPRDWVLSEATRDEGTESKSLRTPDFTYLVSYRLPPNGDRSGVPGSPTGEHLFWRHGDPLERLDLGTDRSSVLRQMREQTERLLRRMGLPDSSSSIELDPELEKSLRALGYL